MRARDSEALCLGPNLVLLDLLNFWSRRVQARLHTTKAAPEPPRAAEASADDARAGVGPAESITPASNSQGMAIATPPLR
eukprot:6185005-Pleurochrysis_carterae.AAC.2